MVCEIAGAEAHSRGWSTFDTLHDATNAFASAACQAYAETIHSHAAPRELPSTKCFCRGRKCVHGCQRGRRNTTDALKCRKPNGRPHHPTGLLAHVPAPSPEILSEQNMSVHELKKTIKTTTMAPGSSKSYRYLYGRVCGRPTCCAPNTDTLNSYTEPGRSPNT